MSIQEFEAAYAMLEKQLQAAAKAKAKAKAMRRCGADFNPGVDLIEATGHHRDLR